MQYLEPEEKKRRVSDRKAKIAAHKRMRQRRLRKTVWWLAILAVLVVFYVTIGQSLLASWGGSQAEAAKGTAKGVGRTITNLFGRKELKEEADKIQREAEQNPDYGER
ncbi:MAG: hypothetical protein GTO55_04650 [Armatimonadetes bacterium]|nr:hypothetical protein [Armatimonadota bacterium]NIM23556.1 hypothetical protein [Armatimonadota bacterium]NIM67422.1 hypothetical protein [Armatimonadota bacterium]NIM75923.1 hypothetical protein [Armatimonadota bacterium]NIN05608.1 hypothetical protein [Armatimonadota bacterium]